MKNCKFCQIISGNKKDEEIIYENANFLVLTDKYRRTSVGSICLLIPKEHIANLLELPKELRGELVDVLTLVSTSVQKAYHCKGIRVWTAINKEAEQSILHCHIHILPCKTLTDRIIAAIPGLYDLKKKLTYFGKSELPSKVNFELAEKIRKVVRQSL